MEHISYASHICGVCVCGNHETIRKFERKSNFVAGFLQYLVADIESTELANSVYFFQ